MLKKDPNRGPTVFPASGDVGSQYTPAAGWAQAITYRLRVLGESDWEGAIAVALGGDGSVAANGFWSSLNIVTTMQLPMLYFIEDNGYGLSVPSTIQTPGGNIAANLASFKNLTVSDADGTQPEEAWQAINDAVKHVRAGKGPVLLRMRVVRIKGHTFIDDQAYKTLEQRASETERDPLHNMREFLLSQGVSEDEWDKMVAAVREELSLALEEAKASAGPDPTQVTKHLFFNGEFQQSGGLQPENANIPMGTSILSDSTNTHGPRINFIDAVRRTLETEMGINPRILVFGEDVGVKGGVHGATMGMQAHFGSERVFDTSLSEEGIIGRSVGMAFAGLLPIPEIQFRKYADPAHEQISDLGTIRWRSGNKFAAPVVVRIPVGFGKKTGDPYHSVTAEAVYAHTLGWRIAYPSNAEDAVGLLRSALRGVDPTFFFEHRALLDTAEGRRPYPGDDYSIPFGTAQQLTKGDELTVVTWGAMVPRCLKAAEPFQGQVEILDLRTIMPWDQEAVLESVRETGRLLVVHEDTLTGGFAGEIIATVVAQAFPFLDAPIERLATPDIPIPYNIPMMNAIIPSVERISEKMAEILEF
jgi:2-oxoisovalerate dehydrogenase E1 component